MSLGIYWRQFIDPSFWLTSNPGDLSRTFEIVFIVILVLFYGGYFIIRKLQKNAMAKKNGTMVEFFRKVSKMLLTMAVIFTFLFFFREEGVPYLGGRYMFFVWALIALVWIGYLKYYFFRRIPKIVEQRTAQATPAKSFKNPYQR